MFERRRKPKKGWYGEEKRHSLSARGIKTGRKNVFRTQTDNPYYNTILKNPDLANGSVHIKYMRPKKYLKESKRMQKAQGFKPEKPDKGLINNYKARVEAGERMPLPYLDYANKKQDSTPEALVAKKLKNKKIPVLVVKERKEHESIFHKRETQKTKKEASTSKD